ncbi:MAG: hypothetical protein ABI759_22685 [Candidatus Solibacter sp.]
MTFSWQHPAAAELITIALAALLVVLLSIVGYRAWRRSRISPEERERRRCAQLVAAGKITDAMLVELAEPLVFYSYSVRGVEYTASQDISRFQEDPTVNFSGVSALSVKYDPRNPANSIVLAEAWSGLRGVPRMAPEQRAR